MKHYPSTEENDLQEVMDAKYGHKRVMSAEFVDGHPVGDAMFSDRNKRQAMIEHCHKCSACDHWLNKILIYERKIERHMDKRQQSGIATANFNSLDQLNNSSALINTPHLNQTMTSFGKQSKVVIKKVKRLTSRVKIPPTGKQQNVVKRKNLLQ